MGTDADLVRRCRAGSAEALRELVDRFQPDVLAVCTRLLGHRHDAEDVAQEAFVRVVRALHTWDAERPLRPWVLGITVNRCRTALSRRKRLPTPTEHLDHVPARPAAGVTGELAAALAAALSGLRQEYREVFVLFHEYGQPYEAIAAAVGRPVGTVKTWLHRARAEMYAELSRGGHIPTLEPEARS